MEQSITLESDNKKKGGFLQYLAIMWKCKLFLADQSWPIFGFHLTSPPSIEKLIHFSLFWSEKRNLCIKNKNKLATKFSLSAIDWFNCRNFFLQKIKRLFCKHFFGEKNDTANCELSALITSPLRGSWLQQKNLFAAANIFSYLFRSRRQQQQLQLFK